MLILKYLNISNVDYVWLVLLVLRIHVLLLFTIFIWRLVYLNFARFFLLICRALFLTFITLWLLFFVWFFRFIWWWIIIEVLLFHIQRLKKNISSSLWNAIFLSSLKKVSCFCLKIELILLLDLIDFVI